MIKKASNKNSNKQSNKKKKTVQVKNYRTNSKNPQTPHLKTRKTNPKTNSQYQMSANLLHNNKQNRLLPNSNNKLTHLNNLQITP